MKNLNISNKNMIRSFFMILFPVLISLNLRGQFFSEESVKMSQIIHWVNKYYVDSINTDSLVEHLIEVMLHDLDPHSSYLSKKEVKAMNEPLQGNFEGIGVTFNILNDTIFIINPISGGPSEKVGIKAGDRIVMIEGDTVAGVGITNQDVIDRLRGGKGTKVNVSIKRRDVDHLMEFTITRDKIPIYSLDASYMVNDRIGYIKLNKFGFTTVQEYSDALEELRSEGMQDMILDLTGNGGGYLDVAVKLADEFLDDKKLIVYTEGDNSPKMEYHSSKKGSFEEGRLIVLIDRGSASASEIVAGAIQDWDRGIIIGRRSFGKGLVQRPLKLADGSMVRLTIARYYTPTGRLIQKPYDEGYEEYNNEVIGRYNSGELIYSDSIQFPESQKFTTLENKRTVYGGGGIMPDFFIPLDTNNFSRYYTDLISRGILNYFVLEYVDDHRNKILRSYPEFDLYLKNFEVSQKLLNEMIEYGESEGLAYEEDQFERSKEQIKRLLKAYIARDVWNTSEFFQVMNRENEIYLKAVEVLKNWDMYHTALQAN